jgi:hypothetical protein
VSELDEGDAITRLKRAAWERSRSKSDKAEADVREVLHQYNDVIREYLDWGAMTGSDRYLFECKFRELLELWR